MDPIAPGIFPDPLPAPRPNPALFAVEGELEAVNIGSCYVLCIDQAVLTELMTYHFQVLKGDKDKRTFGRMRVTIEPLHE